METPIPNRRKISHTGLLDSAIQKLNQLISSPDPGTRSMANRVLADLVQLRNQLPKRRQAEGVKTAGK